MNLIVFEPLMFVAKQTLQNYLKKEMQRERKKPVLVSGHLTIIFGLKNDC